MNNHNSNNRNPRIGITRILIAITIAISIAGVSWIVYESFIDKTPSDVSTKPSETPDPYSGWLQYCSKQEKSCFKYPNTWTAKDVGSVDPSGDGVSLTSPEGTLLWFQSVVSGIGGTCNQGSDPNVYIDKVIPVPNVPNLYIIETKYGNTGDITHIGLVNEVYGQTPQTGDIGYCINYTTFKSRHDPSAQALFEINGNSTEQLKPIDIPTVELILKSYIY